MELTGKLKFKCEKKDCPSEIEVFSQEFDFDNTWSDDDRSMGSELGYEAIVEKTCAICNSAYEIKYEYSEYPVGAPNDENFSMDKQVEFIENTLSIF